MKISNILFYGMVALFLSSGCATKVDYVESSNNGRMDISRLEEKQWFLKEYRSYKPQKSALGELRDFPADAQIIFFGSSWDEGTKKYLPQMYKITDNAKINENNVHVYFLNENLESISRVEQSYQIEKIPTMVIIKDGKVVSRIDEFSEVLENTFVKALPIMSQAAMD